MDGHTLVANHEQSMYALFYQSKISKPEAEQSEQEKHCVMAAFAGPLINSVLRNLLAKGVKTEPNAAQMRAIEISGMRGIDQEFDLKPTLKCRVRVVLSGTYAYGAMVMWKADGSDELARAYLNAVKIEP